MFGTVDLSRFTSLKHLFLALVFNRYDVDEGTATSIASPLVSILSTVATHQLEKLDLHHDDYTIQCVDSILATLSGLKIVDAILSYPKFRCLRYVHFKFHLRSPRK